MIADMFNDALPVILCCTLPGAAGGLVLFLWSFKRGHYRNNKYVAKFSIEIIGAMITATFIAILLKQGRYQIVLAFIMGIGWSGIVQTIRTKITKLVEVALGEKIDGGAG